MFGSFLQLSSTVQLPCDACLLNKKYTSVGSPMLVLFQVRTILGCVRFLNTKHRFICGKLFVASRQTTAKK